MSTDQRDEVRAIGIGEVILKVAAVIPAYNEEKRLGAVLEAVKSAESLDEILVVNDGSSDGTYAAAACTPGVRVIDLKRNLGKGGAMRAGAERTDADVVIFLDADLIGLEGKHVDAIVGPVKSGDCDMAIGVFRAGRAATDIAQKLVPYISGQRALTRERFLSIPDLHLVRSGVEIAITKFYNSRGLRVESIVIEGVTHAMKEEKMGFARGFVARLRMYRDIAKILMDGRSYSQSGSLRHYKVKSKAQWQDGDR